MSVNHRRISLAVASGLILEIINKIAPLVILHHAQKVLGLSDFGWAQIQLAVFETVQPIIAFGLSHYVLTNDKARADDPGALRDLFSGMFAIKAVNALVILLFFLIQQGSNFDPLAFGILSFVLIAYAADGYWICIQKHKLPQVTLSNGILRLISLVLTLTLVQKASDRYLFVLLTILPNALISIGTGVYAYRLLSLSRIAFSRILVMIRGATPFALLTLILAVVDRADLLLVERFFGLEASGIYAGPSKVAQSLSIIVTTLALPFFAEMLKVEEPSSLKKHVALSLWFLSVLSAPIVFGVPFVQNNVLPWLFPELPVDQYYLLGLLCISIAGTVLYAAFGMQLLLAKAQPVAVIKASLSGLIVLLVVFLAGQSSLGLNAAAFGSIAGKVVFGLLTVIMARRFLPGLPLASYFKPYLAGAIMGVALFSTNLEGLALKILAGGSVYLLALFALNLKELRSFAQHPKLKGTLGRLPFLKS